MAIVLDRNTMDPSKEPGDAVDNDIPLGTFLYEALPDLQIDSVEAVRELRERE